MGCRRGLSTVPLRSFIQCGGRLRRVQLRNGWIQTVGLRHIESMTQPEKPSSPVASVEEVQEGWNELKLKVEQAAAERTGLEAENKALRFLVDQLIQHRQQCH